MKTYTDIELIRDILPKDKKKAFSIVYERYFKDVFRFIYSRCGNKQVSEDVTAETFIVFWEVMHKFDGESKLKSFIIGISLNKLRHYFQKENFKTEEFNEEFLEELNLEDYSEEKDEKIEEQTKKILEKLPERYKEILTLRFIENRSTEEIAKIMNITKDNVRKLQSRALLKANELSLEN